MWFVIALFSGAGIGGLALLIGVGIYIHGQIQNVVGGLW